MTKLLRRGPWADRQGDRTDGPFAPKEREERSSAPASRERPEMVRGRITSIRRFRSADAPELLHWGKHEDVFLESYNLHIHNVDDALRWFQGRQSYADTQLYAVDSLMEARVVGYISLREIDLSRRSSVLGISFDPNVVSSGYGTDSLGAFLCYYFEAWKYNVMLLDVAAINKRGQRCYEKCGFQYTGQTWKPFVGSTRQALKEPVVAQYPDLFRYTHGVLSMLYYDMAISREEWLAKRARSIR